MRREDLHRTIGGVVRRFRRTELRHRGFERRPLAALARVGSLEHQHPRRIELGCAVCEHPLDRLVVGDRLAERFVLFRMSDRGIEGRLADAERLRGDRDAPAVERPHCDLEAVAGTTEERIRLDTDVVELQVHAAKAAHAQRVGGRETLDAGRVERHQERADAAPAAPRLRRREDDGHGRCLRVRDPDLAAIQHVSLLIQPCDGLLVCGAVVVVDLLEVADPLVLARERLDDAHPGDVLGERGRQSSTAGVSASKRADPVARDQLTQPRLLLRIRAELVDGFRDERVVHACNDGNDGAGTCDGLERERVTDVVPARTAPRRRNRDAEQAAGRHLLHELAWEHAALVDHRCRRRNPRPRKLRDVRLEGLLVVGQIENHRRPQGIPVAAGGRV